MAKRIATVVGVTLVAVGLVMLIAPVWVSYPGTYPTGTCDGGRGVGVLSAFTLKSNRGGFNDACRAAGAIRLYHAIPWIVIGVGALFFPGERQEDADWSQTRVEADWSQAE